MTRTFFLYPGRLAAVARGVGPAGDTGQVQLSADYCALALVMPQYA